MIFDSNQFSEQLKVEIPGTVRIHEKQEYL